MLTVSMLLIPTLGLVSTGQVLPDELDILRGINRVPQVALLLDRSCSMSSSVPSAPACPGFPSNPTGPYSKNELLKATLTGCQDAGTGILDQWHDTVKFAIMEFPKNSGLGDVQTFTHDLGDLETAVLSVDALGPSTPMVVGIRDTGEYFNNSFNDGNTVACRPNFIVLLSDGEWNGNPADFDYECTGEPAQCSGGDPNHCVNTEAPLAARHLAEANDFLCSVTNDPPDEGQLINTYTIGFGDSGYSPTNLSSIAAEGHGAFIPAGGNIEELNTAFESIIATIVDRSAVFYSSPAVARDGLFSGNSIYLASYRPRRSSRWNGNVKKYCIFPSRDNTGDFDISEVDCIFTSPDGKTLNTNPAAEDAWNPAFNVLDADVGGAGEKMFAKIGPSGGTPAAVRPRRILTYDVENPGGGYVAVQPGTWSTDQAYSNGEDHHKLLNYLHGFTYDANAAGNPVEVQTWPLGDPVHAPAVLIPFGDCDAAAGQCWVVVASNDGMVHFYDAYTGIEDSAIVLGELWKPNNVAHNRIGRILDQPASDSAHRYYVDGGMRLFHVDLDGDGLVDDSGAVETAYLILSLGRGGRAVYTIPVTGLRSTSGQLDSNTPVRPITPDSAEFAELRDVWYSPWAGRIDDNGTIKNIAVFGSGHIREFDAPTKQLPSAGPQGKTYSATALSDTCQNIATLNGEDPLVCTDYRCPGGAGCFPAPFNQNNYADWGIPLEFPLGPFSITNAIRYRVRFASFNLQSDDYVSLFGGDGKEYARLTGAGTTHPTRPLLPGLDGSLWTPWVNSDEVSIRLFLGATAGGAAGAEIAEFQWHTAVDNADATHYPTMYVVDLDVWNASGNDFQPIGTGAVVARFAKACTGANCVTAGDTGYMTCPITGEPSVYTVASKLSAIYWGDECGQIFKAHRPTGPTGAWTVRRLFAAYGTAMNGLNDQSTAIGQSKDFRKMFRKLDIVSSRCPGQKVVGIYWGTGNVQRPAATDELTAAPGAGGVASGRDVLGVIWDDGIIGGGASPVTLADLENLTVVASKPATDIWNDGNKGWYWQLGDDERMLRNPLVFQGIAFFKTFVTSTPAAECVNAAGIDTVYAVDNCSSEAIVDSDGNDLLTVTERVAHTSSPDLGGDLVVLTPKDGAPIVSHGDLTAVQAAAVVPGSAERRIPYIYHWRIPRGL